MNSPEQLLFDVKTLIANALADKESPNKIVNRIKLFFRDDNENFTQKQLFELQTFALEQFNKYIISICDKQQKEFNLPSFE